MTHELNSQQRAAVDSSARDLFLTAGAGSGKTLVLTESYASWVERLGARALDSVLTITFTEKAAGEIAERVRVRLAGMPDARAISRDVDSAWISTIHGMCSRLLRRHALEAGLDPLFRVGAEVQLGVLRLEAFEEVAHAALDESGPSADLIRAFGPNRLFECIEKTAEQLRSLGALPEHVRRVEPVEDWLAVSISSLGRLIEAYRSAHVQNGTVADNMSAARDLLGALERLAATGEGARETAVLAANLKQEKRGSQELKDLAEEGRAIFAVVAANAAQEAAGSFEAAFLEMVDAYQLAFSRLKAAHQLLDFEDLQTKVIELFESHPEIARRYSERFAAVMIDEFQDTNILQVRLIRALAPHGFFTVGDEKQSIYRFRHADVDLFRAKAATASEVLPLSVNYRSHPALLGFFNEIFSRPPFWPDDYMSLQPGAERERDALADELFGPGRVTALLVDNNACGEDKHADEATILAAHIRQFVDAGYQQSDIVILMRAMTHADTYASALRDLGLEAFVASGGTYFDRPEVADLEMLLRAVANPLDDEAMAHVLAGPMTGLSADAMGLLRLQAGRSALWTAATALGPTALSQTDLERLSLTVEVMCWARERVGRLGLADLIHEMCERLEYDLVLFARGFDGARAWANVLKLARIAEEFELDDAGDPQAFIEHLRLKREHEGRESLAAFAAEDVDAVRIMSVHAAKGLEFPITVAATLGHHFSPSPPIMLSVSGGMATLGMKLPCPDGDVLLDTLGHRTVADFEAEAEIAESKRVFYVACTRAEEALVLCGRTNLDKEPADDRPIGWLRTALDSAEPVGDEPDVVRIGESKIRVLYATPDACELPGAVRPQVDDLTLTRARQLPAGHAEQPGQGIERISYSGLARYRACPYKFYSTAVARLGSHAPREPEAESPTAFGTAVHAVLRTVRDGRLPEPARIAEICKAARLGPDRVPRVSEVSASYLESEAAKRVDGCERVMREVPFAVPVGGVLLDGVIDLIAWAGVHAIVVDYKTGHTDERYDPTDSYRMQAECYAVAAGAMGALTVEVSFVELENESRVRTFGFETLDTVSAKGAIEATIARIRAGEFGHLEGYDALVCAECAALGNLCPVSSPPLRAV